MASISKFISLAFFLSFVLILFTPRCRGNNAGNWTLEDLLKYRQNSTMNKMASHNCSTFYDLEETTKYLNECAIAIGENNSDYNQNQRSRRDVLTVLDPDFEFDVNEGHPEGERAKRSAQAIGEKEFLPSGIRIRVHNPWRIMESKAILDMPCIGQCMMERMSILDETGRPDRAMIVSKLLEVLEVAKLGTKDATKIADKCIKHFQTRIDKVAESTDSSSDKEIEKCRVASRLGICLSRDAYHNCRNALIGSTTSTKYRPRRPKSSEEN